MLWHTADRSVLPLVTHAVTATHAERVEPKAGAMGRTKPRWDEACEARTEKLLALHSQTLLAEA